MKNRIFLLVFLASVLSSCNDAGTTKLSLWYSQPAEKWTQALPVGNGRLGAMVYGGIENETVALNEITLWAGQIDENQEIACGKEKLTLIRRLFTDGNLEEGNHLGSQYLSGTPHSFGTHLPLGDLKINFALPSGEISDYRRELDIENSIATVDFKAGGVVFSREYFCSYPDSVLIIRLEADKKQAINCTLSLDLLREAKISAYDNELLLSGKVNFPKQGAGGVNFLGKIRVEAINGAVAGENDCIKISDCDEAIIFVDLRTDYCNENFVELCSETVTKAAAKRIGELKTAHLADYRNLFDRVKISLGEDDADKLPVNERLAKIKTEGDDDLSLAALFFQYGRYLLISSSRETSPLPANLQGVWNDNLACNMGWTCDYHLDINTEQNYWLSNVGNLAECNKPLFDYLNNLSVAGEKTAEKVYGCRGWVAHTVANVWGYTAPGQSVNWGLAPTVGAWLATHLWTQFEFTRDTLFLRNEAFPILKKTSQFFLDYLFFDSKTGYLMSGPSISPENSFISEGKEYSLSLSPTIDRVVIAEIFSATAQAAEILGTNADFCNSLRESLSKMPPIKIGSNGSIQEWFYDYGEAHPEHRHSSHLLSLYPFSQISVERTPELADAAALSVYNKLHSSGYEDVEWSRANNICFYARLKKPKEAYDNLKGLFATFTADNLFTIAPAGIAGAEDDIFEFDANEAAPAGIAEMLIQSHEGYIEFLPSLPEQWKTGSFSGLCARGGAVCDLKWENGCVRYARLEATVNNTFSVKIPKNHHLTKMAKNKQNFDLQEKNGGIITFSLNKGDFVEILF